MRVVGNIGRIYTVGNSCYSAKFSELGISDLHIVAPGKTETHMIEAVNSSIRDNLARFNRRSKRYSKCEKMLDYTLLLFFNQKQFNISKK
jgi:IS1 family transposase